MGKEIILDIDRSKTWNTLASIANSIFEIYHYIHVKSSQPPIIIGSIIHISKQNSCNTWKPPVVFSWPPSSYWTLIIFPNHCPLGMDVANAIMLIGHFLDFLLWLTSHWSEKITVEPQQQLINHLRISILYLLFFVFLAESLFSAIWYLNRNVSRAISPNNTSNSYLIQSRYYYYFGKNIFGPS